MIVLLKFITNLVGVEVKGSADSSIATLISVDNVKALVIMGELDWYKEVHDSVLPKFDKEYTEACVIEYEEDLTLRPEERRTQKCALTQKNSQHEMGTAVDGRGMGDAVSGAVPINRGRRVDPRKLGKELLAWGRKTEIQHFFSAGKDLEAGFNKRSKLRESLLAVWNVDIHKRCAHNGRVGDFVCLFLWS